MSEPTQFDVTGEISLPKILRDELNHIKPELTANGEKSADNLNEVFNDLHRAELSALCFSGGGIRSATFGLGIVQALAKHDVLDKFDYLSTVSGGGYLGSWLSAWIRREQLADFETELAAVQAERALEYAKPQDSINYQKILDFNDQIAKINLALFNTFKKTNGAGVAAVQTKLNEHSIPKADETCPNIEPKQLQYLREYSNYMSPKVGLLSADTWTLVAIYTRNLFLNWTIFIPLIGAVLLIPRILLAIVKQQIDETGLDVMLLLGLFIGIVAVFFTVSKLPSKNSYLPKKKREIDLKAETAEKRWFPDWAAINRNTDVGVFLTVIFPMILMAFAATTFWAWYHHPGAILFSSFQSYRFVFQYETVNFVIFSAAIFVVGNLSLYVFKKLFYANAEFRFWEFVSALASSSVGGVITWLVSHNFFDADYFANPEEHHFRLLIYICFAVPLYLLSFSIASSIFTGIYSRIASDEDREWLARQGAWIMIVCVAWLALNGLVFFGPIFFERIFDTVPPDPTQTYNLSDRMMEFLKLLVSLIAGVSGILSLVGGFSGKSAVKSESHKSNLSRFLAVAPKIASVIFLAFIFVGLALLSSILIDLVAEYFNFYFFGNQAVWLMFPKDARHLQILNHSSIGFLLIWLLVLSAVGFVMACFINVNKFSLHAAYRDRLIRAYLGASHTRRRADTYTGFDDTDNFQLHRLKGQKPFHVINATLNLADGKNLAWQNRKAASFTMSPLYCGSWLIGYRHTDEYCRNKNLPPCEHLRYCNRRDKKCFENKKCELPGKALRLGTAMAISGAAANPNMGYYSSPVVMFLMSLFNIRLGWWLGNTGTIGDDLDFWKEKVYTKTSPSIAVLPLLNETLGRTDENKRFLNITDGGHFENLGLYEMVLRRCKLIVLSDAAADDKFAFGEISNAIEKCKVDLGVDIVFKNGIHLLSRHAEITEETVRKRFAIADIIYPEPDPNAESRRRTGKLLYIRPTYYGDEATEIKHYADANATFPHQSTADQLYDEKQFEAYRALGFHITEEIIKTKSSAALFKSLVSSAERND